jgi:hypothetical protein
VRLEVGHWRASVTSDIIAIIASAGLEGLPGRKLCSVRVIASHPTARSMERSMLQRLITPDGSYSPGHDGFGAAALGLVIWRLCDLWERLRHNHPPSMI